MPLGMNFYDALLNKVCPLRQRCQAFSTYGQLLSPWAEPLHHCVGMASSSEVTLLFYQWVLGMMVACHARMESLSY